MHSEKACRILSHLGRLGQIPLVTVHFGASEYLIPFVQHTLDINRHLFFLGDSATESYLQRFQKYDGFVHINVETQLQQGFQKLFSYYQRQHASPNNPQFEFLCIFRAFIMTRFLVCYGLPSLFHIDTDVLIVTKPESWAGHPGIPWIIDASQDAPLNVQSLMIAASYITLEVIAKVLHTFYEAYVWTDCFLNKHNSSWKSKVDLVRSGHGAVSDMTLWWIGLRNVPIDDLAAIDRKGGEADIRMSMSGRFQMVNGMKHVDKGCFYVHSCAKPVQALTLHFSGPLKRMIGSLA
jgi:hypothetical protein